MRPVMVGLNVLGGCGMIDDFVSRNVDAKRLTCLLLFEVFVPSGWSVSSDGLDDVCLTNALLIRGS